MTAHSRTRSAGLSRRRLLTAALATGGAAAAATAAGTAYATRPDGATADLRAADYPGPGAVTGDVEVHDPGFVKRPGGGYLVAHTAPDIALKTSGDRTAFRDAGTVFPGGAPWTTEYTGGDRNLWAPHLSYADGRYLLYYSASTFGSNRSAIFLATSTSGDSGTWTDQGVVVESWTSQDFNAIDPHLSADAQGRWWLAFGSYWSGIKMIRIDPATGKRLGDAWHSLAGRGGDSIEAPTVFRHGGRYYLFVSFGACCQGADSTYRVMAGRSDDIAGPYYDRGGTPMTSGGGTEILAGHGGIHGPGHQDVFADSDSDILAYHYYADDGTALLGVNRLGWDGAGWPYVH